MTIQQKPYLKKKKRFTFNLNLFVLKLFQVQYSNRGPGSIELLHHKITDPGFHGNHLWLLRRCGQDPADEKHAKSNDRKMKLVC